MRPILPTISIPKGSNAMNSETGKNSESAGHGDPKTLEADVRRAVEQGEDI